VPARGVIDSLPQPINPQGTAGTERVVRPDVDVLHVSRRTLEMADNPGKSTSTLSAHVSSQGIANLEPTQSLLWNGTVAPNVAELKRKCADEDHGAIRASGSAPCGRWTCLNFVARRVWRSKNALGPLVESMVGNVNAQTGEGIGRGLRRRQSTIADTATFKSV
jgi:hypothetical protein